MRNKMIWTIIWSILVLILLGIYFFSQANAVDIAEGYIAVKKLPPGSIITFEDFKYSKNIILNQERREYIIRNKNDLIGKTAVLGCVAGEPLTSDKLKKNYKKTSEFTISTTMGNIPHPVEDLKIVDIWIDYNPKDFPLKPIKVVEKIPVKSVRNRKTTEVTDSDDRVPALVVIDSDDLTIAKIREYSRKGTIFFTNPYPKKGE